MTARHYVVGILLWSGLLFFGARWAARPVVWASTAGSCCETVTAEDIREKDWIRLAAISDTIAAEAVSEEEGPENSLVRDWAVRETRNRALVTFVLWMACGFVIHWLMGRIVRGEVDLS